MNVLIENATADDAAATGGAPTRVLLVGGGRMGTLLAAALAADPALVLVGTVDIDNRDDLADGTAPIADLVVDFSHRDMVPRLAAYVRATGAALVSGTTGMTASDLATLRALGEIAPVVHAANYSLGVAVLRRLAARGATELAGWDIEIVETHHNQKADAPSGTALALVDAVRGAAGDANAGSDVDAGGDAGGDEDTGVTYGRHGMVGARPAGEIGVHAIRGGTVAGTHEVHFFGTDEEVCLTHRATSRQIFVTGALAAARRLLERDPGFYTFDELMFG